MSQGKDRTIFTITSAHDPNSDPLPFGNPSLTFREVRFRRNYRMRYPLSLPVLQQTDSASTDVVSNASTRVHRSASVADSGASQADDSTASSSGSSAPAENPSGLSAGTEFAATAPPPAQLPPAAQLSTTAGAAATGASERLSPLMWDAPSDSEESDWSTDSDSTYVTTSDSMMDSSQRSSSSSSSSAVSGSSDNSQQSFLRCSRLRRDYMRFFRGAGRQD